MTKKKPIILFTTPRTGSTLLVNLLYHLGKNDFQYKSCLYEYFFIESLYKSEFKFLEGKIIRTSFERTNHEWCLNKREERLRRLILLKQDPNYMLKIFPTDLEDEIENFITQYYDIVYLERRNKEHQFISFLGLLTHNVSHFQKDDKNSIKYILYRHDWLETFINILSNFNKFKEKYPSVYPTIYYEDFINQENQEDFIKQYLNLGITNYTKILNQTIPTPYIDNPENLIVNKKGYLEGKKILLDFIG